MGRSPTGQARIAPDAPRPEVPEPEPPLGRMGRPKRRSADELRARARHPESSRLDLIRLTLSRRFDVKLLIAGRASSPFYLRPIAHYETEWPLYAALARRPDLSRGRVRRLAKGPAAVRLSLATNPTISASTATRLVYDPDPFVQGVAAGNPATPAEHLQVVGQNMTEPAWVLRRVATNPSCPQRLSDEILTWLAIGGAGDADPLFDPLTCTGNPTDGTVAPFEWYRGKAAETARPDLSVLSRVRACTPLVTTTLKYQRVMALAHDEAAEVRIAAARYKYPTTLRFLVDDESAGVQTQARATLGQLKSRPRSERIRQAGSGRPRNRVMSVLGLFLLLFIFRACDGTFESHPTTTPTTVFPAASAPSPVATAQYFTEVGNLFTFAEGSTTSPISGGGELHVGNPVGDFTQPGSILCRIQAGGTPLVVEEIRVVVLGRDPYSDLEGMPRTIKPHDSMTITFNGLGIPRPTDVEILVQTGGERSNVWASVPDS